MKKILVHADTHRVEKSRENYVHSFVVNKLRDQGWDLRLREGAEDFAVVAPPLPGEYLAECTVKCGRVTTT